MSKFGNIFLLFFTILAMTDTAMAEKMSVPKDFSRVPGFKNWDFQPADVYWQEKPRKIRVVAFSLDKDTDIDAELIAYAFSPAIGNWNACRPFTFAAVTSNKQILKYNDIQENLLEAAISYADILCPKTDRIDFLSSPFLKFDDASKDFFLKVSLMKIAGKWQKISYVTNPDPDSFNVLKKGGKGDAKNKAVSEYERLKDRPFSVKAAFTHDAKDLDNLQLMSDAAAVLGEPANVTAIVHVKSVEGRSAWIDKPMMIFVPEHNQKIEKYGWYLVSGEITPLSEEEKNKSGINLRNKASSIKVTKATACKNESCQEASDVVGFLKNKYKLYDWSPE